MGTSQTYHSLFREIRQLYPQERITRVRTLTWLMVGMLRARSVHLNHIANHMLGQALRASKEQRLRYCQKLWIATSEMASTGTLTTAPDGKSGRIRVLPSGNLTPA
jgi:hypothetical protein